MQIKEVYYEVWYTTKSIWPGRKVTKTFSNRKAAEKFFDSIQVDKDCSKAIILHEETLLDRVY